ncbi:hypothetical protein SDC9_45948 [bioreactor metagenome]|uniref:PPC domain-containing protein n=1 Tax=bioreactor metagenome TaxID=1076179 RepID=A0A644W865_9ZZZZ
MEYRRFGDKIFARIDKGEDIVEQVREIALRENIKLGYLQALGAVGDITVGAFDPAAKTYHSNSMQGKFEIVSLTGTINTMNGEYYSHLHMSVGDDEAHVFGGHLNKAVVSATCEMVIVAVDGAVDRAFSQEIGLNLFRF